MPKPNIYTQVNSLGSNVSVNAYVHLEARISRRAIWALKLKCIWAVIRAKTAIFNEDAHP
jgi:hypothetical protein